MGIRYFHCTEGYLAVTTETPIAFKGLVFVGRGPAAGGGIDTIHEQLYTKGTLDKLPACRAEHVPDDWFDALGYEKRRPVIEVPPEPKPPAEPVWPDPPRPRKRRKRIKADPQVTELVFGSSCETPTLNHIMWLVAALIVTGIFLLGRP